MTRARAWQFCIDRGGTFTDIVAYTPAGRLVTHKLLSDNPEAYADAATAGIADLIGVPRGREMPTEPIASVKMGTTIATDDDMWHILAFVRSNYHGAPECKFGCPALAEPANP